MLRQTIVGIGLLALVALSGLNPPAPARAHHPIAASAPTAYVALADADLAELELASAELSEAELAAAGTIGAEPGDGFRWEYVLIFAVIAGAMALTISID